MPLGTSNSSVFRKRSGHAVSVEFEKTSWQFVASSKVLAVLQMILPARHSVRANLHKNVQQKAGIDCDAAEQTAGKARQARGRPPGDPLSLYTVQHAGPSQGMLRQRKTANASDSFT